MTDEHPFYVQFAGWTPANSLAAGDTIFGADGTLTVVSNTGEAHPQGVAVYNLEVERAHTYFVRAEDASEAAAVWVHNSCSGVGRYDEVLGHHVIGKAAYNKSPRFKEIKASALSISEQEIVRRGGLHRGVDSMTSLQASLYAELRSDIAAGLRHNTMRQHSRIAAAVLEHGGFSPQEAMSLALRANRELRGFGVRPLRVPGT